MLLFYSSSDIRNVEPSWKVDWANQLRFSQQEEASQAFLAHLTDAGLLSHLRGSWHPVLLTSSREQPLKLSSLPWGLTPTLPLNQYSGGLVDSGRGLVSWPEPFWLPEWQTQVFVWWSLRHPSPCACWGSNHRPLCRAGGSQLWSRGCGGPPGGSSLHL